MGHRTKEAVCILTLLLLIGSTSRSTGQTKLPQSFLQPGLKLRYETMADWKARDLFGYGNLTRKGNLTITVLKVDPTTGQIQLRYELSCVETLPSRANEFDLTVLNMDDSIWRTKQPDSTGYSAGYRQVSWSTRSILTLDGRNTIKVEGDRWLNVKLKITGTLGTSTWASSDRMTDFLVGFPTSLFIDPATKPGELVHTWDNYGTMSEPKLADYSFSINSTQDFTFALGHRTALMYEDRSLPNYKPSGLIHTYSRIVGYYDKESGILLSRESLHMMKNVSGGDSQSDVGYTRLVEVTPFDTAIMLSQISTQIVAGSTVSLNGWLTPTLGGTSVRITITGPDGAQTVQEQVSSNDGKFNSSFPTPNPGNWTILVEHPADIFTKASSHRMILLVTGSSGQSPFSGLFSQLSDFLDRLRGLLNPQNLQQTSMIVVTTVVSLGVGWYFKTRKGRFTSKCLGTIESTFSQYSEDPEECENRLKKMKKDFEQMLKKGKIEEDQLSVLNARLNEYLSDLEAEETGRSGR